MGSPGCYSDPSGGAGQALIVAEPIADQKRPLTKGLFFCFLSVIGSGQRRSGGHRHHVAFCLWPFVLPTVFLSNGITFASPTGVVRVQLMASSQQAASYRRKTLLLSPSFSQPATGYWAEENKTKAKKERLCWIKQLKSFSKKGDIFPRLRILDGRPMSPVQGFWTEPGKTRRGSGRRLRRNWIGSNPGNDLLCLLRISTVVVNYLQVIQNKQEPLS